MRNAAIGESASGTPAAVVKPVQACKLRLRLRTDDCTPPLTGWLKEQLARICELAKVTRGDITLVVVADAEMAKLHEQFTGVEGTTDVLTFDHRDDKRQPIESDLILCLDTACREAKERGHETRLEVLLYAVHGLNHLLGGDDHTYAGAKAMHQWEDKMLSAAGFGAVFHRPNAAEEIQQNSKQISPRQTKAVSNKRSSNHPSAAGQSGRPTGAKKTRTHTQVSSQAHAKTAGRSQKKVRRQNGSAKGHAT